MSSAEVVGFGATDRRNLGEKAALLILQDGERGVVREASGGVCVRRKAVQA